MIKAKLDVKRRGPRKGKVVMDGRSDDVIREIGWILHAFWQTVPDGMEIKIRAKLMDEIYKSMRRDV